MVLKSELNARNKITAIGTLILRYSFGIINWRLEEIKQIYRKTRKMPTMYKMYQPKPDIDKLLCSGQIYIYIGICFNLLV
jgi:hypothetical protein